MAVTAIACAAGLPAAAANRGGVAGPSTSRQASVVLPKPTQYSTLGGRRGEGRTTRAGAVVCSAHGIGGRPSGHSSYGKPLQRVEALLADCPPSEFELAPRLPSFENGPSTEEVLPAWFELCLGDLVRNLNQAPFLQGVYDAKTLLTRGTEFVTHQVSEGSFAGAGAWDEVARLADGRSARTLIFVHKVGDPNTSACGQQYTCDDCPNTQAANRLLRQGSIGDCCDEDLYEEAQHSHSAMDTKTSFWGLVMQSAVPGEPKGCYLLKTEQNVTGDCSCTHFSLTKVCEAVPLERQLVEAWTC